MLTDELQRPEWPVPVHHGPNVSLFDSDGYLGIVLVEDEIDGSCALIHCENPVEVKR